MQVFISYAHTPADTDLARYVAARLRDLGYQPWLDQELLTAGGDLQASIENAIKGSQAGVFLLSPSWAVKDWTAFELEQFGKSDPAAVRRVPVLRLPRERLTVPPVLTRQTGIVWLEDDADNDARFWELYCALTDTAPGPAEEWSPRGAKLSPASAKIPPPRRPRPVETGRPSLKCDRALQWTTVDTLARDTSHEVILVPGAAGQAHEHFLERVQLLLRMDPPRSVAIVDWPTRPLGRDEFREALARSLNVTPASLAREMGLRLARTNIVLLHPCVRARFIDDAIVKYYAVWLPELIEECQPQMNLKCLQPVEWPPDAGMAAKMLTWLRFRGPGIDEGKPQAEQLIGRVRAAARTSLPAIRLHELQNITDDDLNAFCDVIQLSDAQKAWLLSHITMRGATTPKEIFQAIDDYLPDARSVT